MCGVFATMSPARFSDAHVLSTLANRGPDASGWTSAADVAFGHTRLAIIGLGDAGAQPMRDDKTGDLLTFNGEIYNYRELARQFALGPATSDTQVLFALLQRMPVAEVVATLRGMWAFAFWHAESRTLSATRDHCGIKPLYHTSDASGRPTVASSIPALLNGAAPVDPVGLTGFVATGRTGPERTVYAGVRKVVPGQVLSWQMRGEDVSVARIDTQMPMLGDAATIEEALTDSVASHLVSDVRVGAFLSGGVDSTLLVATAARLGSSLETFTLAFPGSAADESALAAANARALGVVNHVVPVTPREMADAAESFLVQHGEPFGDAACLPLTLLARASAEHVKVVLCGEGADELFGGYGRYRVSAHLRRRAGALSPLARRVGRLRSGSARSRAVEASLWGGGAQSHWALLDSDLAVLPRTSPLVLDYLAEGLADWSTLCPPDGDHLATSRAFDRARWLPDVFLEKTDRATMAAGLEARVPFLDTAVVPFAPDDIADTSKAALRSMLSSLLPDVKLPYRKKGLAVDIRAVQAAGLDQHLQHAVRAGGVLDEVFGSSTVGALENRVSRSATTAFRLAMVGLWEERCQPGLC